jgi:hypothetical protein
MVTLTKNNPSDLYSLNRFVDARAFARRRASARRRVKPAHDG